MKVCIDCGCNLPDDHIGNICECCRDDRGDTIPDGLRSEESLYPKIRFTTSGPVREDFERILESRLSELVERDLSDKPREWCKVNPFLFRGYGVLERRNN